MPRYKIELNFLMQPRVKPVMGKGTFLIVPTHNILLLCIFINMKQSDFSINLLIILIVVFIINIYYKIFQLVNLHAIYILVMK